MNRAQLKRRFAALALAIMMLTVGARADNLKFPEGLREIEEEAFKGDKAVTAVVLPDSLRTIGARAFMNCSKLKSIKIPAGVTSLGTDFLAGCPSDVLIKTTAGSAAMRYAQNNHIDYKADDTVYRALLIGQTYPGTTKALRGPANNVPAMKACLQSFGTTKFNVTVRYNQTADGILNNIATTFAGAQAQDVSLFYYSGHGTESNDPSRTGALVGTSGRVTASDLRTALDKIPGRKIVIIDACFSGNLIGPGTRGLSGSEEDFVDSFISVFSATPRKNLEGESYFVLTAASDSESSWEYGYSNNSSSWKGVFTTSFLKGCGYDMGSKRSIKKYADANGNGVLTLKEVYSYTKKEALSLANSMGISQHAQVYPTGCDWFGLFR